jgi:hypothetical protein
MTEFDRRASETSRGYLLAASCVLSLVLLSGCTGFKQMIGLDTQPPDEFTVESRAPLVVPPGYDLRPPQPGAPRPQEASAAAKAQQAINAAGPGQPGNQATAGLHYAEGGQPDPNLQVASDRLAQQLLMSGDINSGATIEKRETTPLQGVY